MTRMPEVVEMDVVAGLGTEGARRATGGRASGMAARLEVKILTQSPDRGNLTPKRQGRRPGGTGAAGWGASSRALADSREGASGGSHRCATVSSESEAP